MNIPHNQIPQEHIPDDWLFPANFLTCCLGAYFANYPGHRLNETKSQRWILVDSAKVPVLAAAKER